MQYSLIIKYLLRETTYLIEFLKWSSAGFFTVQLFSNHKSASAESSRRQKDTNLC